MSNDNSLQDILQHAVEAAAAADAERGGNGDIRPATFDELQGYLIPEYKDPKVGDIVTMREGMGHHIFPRPGDLCIVTQVLDRPYRHGDTGHSECGDSCDIALGFTADGRSGRQHTVEFLYDHRLFRRVGNVWDKVSLKSLPKDKADAFSLSMLEPDKLN